MQSPEEAFERISVLGLGATMLWTVFTLLAARRHPLLGSLYARRLVLLTVLSLMVGAFSAAWLLEFFARREATFGYGGGLTPASYAALWFTVKSTMVAASFPLIGAIITIRPNKALEPTTTAVTSPAAQEPRQP